ncbi:transposase, partial [Shewanella sairae]
MPNKHNHRKRHHFKKGVYRISNSAQYTNSLRNRGRIDIWLCEDILNNWQFDERSYDGSGSSVKYPNRTIEACHHLRMVFKLPLRQTQGFIDNLLQLLESPHLRCPDYTLLSKRLNTLGITTPRFKNNERMESNIVAIAIDSTGLKRFGRDEWHQEKHKVDGKLSWMKAHF